MDRIELALAGTARIGESPVWSAAERALYWTEIHGFKLHRFDTETGEDRVWRVKEKVASFALCDGGGLVAALHGGFALIDLQAGTLIRLARPFRPELDVHLNDGRCDRSGRCFWSGTLHEPRTRQNGELFRLSGDGTATHMAGGVIASNGIAFSPDNRVLYYADSRGLVIWAFDHDPATGTVTNRRIFVAVPPGEGLPDGAAVDAEGCYWSARFMGRRIVRYRPDGSIDRELAMPVDNATMVAFGGPDYRTLYITTGHADLGADKLERQPWAGGILKMPVDVPGLPEPAFRPDPGLRKLPTESLAPSSPEIQVQPIP
jgi:sugar lactone lactonase YvrE